MNKIILILILQLTTLLAYTISEGSLTKGAVQTNNVYASDWVPAPLPSKAFNVLDYGLKGDGTTDDSAALKALAKNTSVTNWYFPKEHTFLLMDVNPPAHVTHIWGGGTILQHDGGNTDSSVYIYGAFSLWRNGVMANPNLVIDGLTFESTGVTSIRAPGIIYFSKDIPPNTTINQMEIRNCTFNNSGPMDAIKGFSKTSENRYHENIKIHHNLFTGGGGYFNIEFGNQGGEVGDGFPGFEVSYNRFENAGNHGNISLIVFETTDMKVFNNYSTGGEGYWIELPEAKGIEVYNNLVLSQNGNPVNEGGNTWNVSNIEQKGNHYHHNHFEIQDGVEKFVHLFGGASATLFENNYIKGHMRMASAFNLIDGQDPNFGTVTNNTIVHTVNDYSTAAAAIMVYNGIGPSGGTFSNNNLYIDSSQSGLSVTSGIDPSAVIENNPVYTSTPPTSMDGVGLTVSINEIGPQ